MTQARGLGATGCEGVEWAVWLGQEPGDRPQQGSGTELPGTGAGGHVSLLPESARLPNPALGHLADGARGQGCTEGSGLGRAVGGSVLEVNPEVALPSGAPHRVRGPERPPGLALPAPTLSLAQVRSEEPGVRQRVTCEIHGDHTQPGPRSL